MTNLRETLDILKRARAILDVSYIRFQQTDYKGGHCSLGAISVARGVDATGGWEAEAVALSETARALHPELRGKISQRVPDYWLDIFDDCPIVFVNNHLGKEETLRVWDVTIAELELRLAAEELAADAPTDSPCVTPECSSRGSAVALGQRVYDATSASGRAQELAQAEPAVGQSVAR